MTNREEVAERLRVYATGFDFGESNPPLVRGKGCIQRHKGK